MFNIIQFIKKQHNATGVLDTNSNNFRGQSKNEAEAE